VHARQAQYGGSLSGLHTESREAPVKTRKRSIENNNGVPEQLLQELCYARLDQQAACDGDGFMAG